MAQPGPAADGLDAEEYLDRCGVTAYMKDVVTLLLENRPESPVAFIAQYFRTVTQGGTSPLLRAYRYVRLASPDQREAFVDNLVAAYSTLDARRGVGGVTGAELLRLLRLVCADCPIDVSRSVMVLLDRTEIDQVGFPQFSAAVQAGLHYDAFFQRATSLFAACDPKETGVVPHAILRLARRLACGGAAAGAAAALAAAHADASAGAAAPSGAPVAARAELASLQREAQSEVAKLLGSGAHGGISPAAAPAAAGPGAGCEPVALDEFLRSLFAASLGKQPMSAAALEAANVRCAVHAPTSAAAAAGVAAVFRGAAGGPTGGPR